MPPTPAGPSRHRGASRDAYVPFNQHPKEVGTRTGKLMRTHVPLTEEGFEDADEFFRSSPTAGRPSYGLPASSSKSPRSSPRTPRGAPGGSRGAGSSSPTVATLGKSSVRKSRVSRLSDLGAAEEVDIGMDMDEDLLIGDDDDLLNTPPGQRQFQSSPNPPASVAPQRRSQLALKSPSVGPGLLSPMIPTRQRDTPSSGRKGKETPSSGRKGKSRRATEAEPPSSSPRAAPSPPLNALSSPVIGFDDSMNLDDDVEVEQERRRGGSHRKSKSARLITPPLGASSPLPPDSVPMPSRRKSSTRGPLPRDESEDEAVADSQDDLAAGTDMSFEAGFDAGGDVDMGGDFGDDDMGDMGGDVDDAASILDPEPLQQFSESESDDDALERQAVAAENRGGSGTDSGMESDYAEQRPKSRSRSTTAPRRTAIRTTSQPPKPKRKRVSQLPTEEDSSYKGDFKMRRSGRQHFAPLKWWAGERFEYQRGQTGPQIVEVVKVPDAPQASLVKVRRPAEQARSRANSVRSGRENTAALEAAAQAEQERDLDQATATHGPTVAFPDDNTENVRRIALPSASVNPRPVQNAKFLYQKAFGEDRFMAAGIVELPVGGTKPGKSTRDNAYVFYIIDGVVQVTIHTTQLVLSTGSMFFVPRGNEYEIVNASNKVARLHFTQARKIHANDREEDWLARNPSPATDEEEGPGLRTVIERDESEASDSGSSSE